MNHILIKEGTQQEAYFYLGKPTGILAHCPFKTPFLIPAKVEGNKPTVEYHPCRSDCALFDIIFSTTEPFKAKVTLGCKQTNEKKEGIIECDVIRKSEN